MKKSILILGLTMSIIFTISAQITDLKYLIEYNDSTNLYDCKIVIIGGEATTYPQRIQFNTQYTLVVPTGTALTIEELHAPFEANQFYTGTIPCLWEFGPKEYSPPTQPEHDFHTIFPNLSPVSAFNDLYSGDTITLFSIFADIDPCENTIRSFNTDTDPSSIEMPSGGDFSNGYSFGGVQTYIGNLSAEYGNNYISSNDSLLICVGDCITLEPKILCHPDSLKYEWSTGDTTEVIEVCPTEPTSYYLWIKDMEGNFLDSIPIFVGFDPIISNPGNNIACAGNSILLKACTDGGTWSQSSANAFGATLTQISGAVTEASFSEFADGPYDFIFSIPGLSDTIRIIVHPAPLVNVVASQICKNEQTVAVSNIQGGIWESNDPLIATIDPITGVVTGNSSGVVTFTFIDTFTGCYFLSTDTLWVQDDPIVVFTGDDRLCIGETSSVSPNTGGTWVSNNTSVATIVAGTGIITAVAQGAATFTFTDASTGCMATTGLIVDPNPSVSTDFDSICITAMATLSPSSGGVWVAVDPGIASLVGNTITGVASGDAGFLFTSDATGCVSDTLFINVDTGPTTTLTGPNQICIGNTTTITPSSGGTWASSDPSIATIDNFGNITGVGSGVATFIFTSATTLCASDPSAPVQVTPAPIVSAPSTSLCITETMNLSPGFGGTWVSSDPSVATVNAFTGLVTAVSDGSVTFTFTAAATGCFSLLSDPIVVEECIMLPTSCEDINPNNVYCDYSAFGQLAGSLNSEDSQGDQPSGILCDSEAGNIVWLGFIALEGDYEILISSNNCIPQADGSPGIQVGLYSSCDFNENDKVFCDVGSQIENEIIIPSEILITGNIYYMYIDGIDNSTCDFDIDINGNYDNTYCTDLSKVTGVAYVDDNENGIYDMGEILLRNALISLSPGNFSVLTNDEGKYIINAPKGEATLTAKMNEGHWISNELTIEDLTIFETCVEGVNFGFVPNLFYQEANISVANTMPRCDWETRFYFTIENTGTIDLDARFEFEFDSKTSYFTTNLPGLQVNGSVASGDLGIIKSFEVREFWITLKMPSGSAILPILDFKTSLYNSAGMEIDQYEHSEQLRCSYDPNDKREYPNREGEDNLTLMDEDIEYTIRFQNNGNDTAFQVKIVDPLDPNIDKTSIRVISSSHPVETCIADENLIFLFENINLVDSMTNYDGSQGFVSFRCSTKEDRSENTIVNNTADIIFDTNEPIVTNTTINTLVSELCTNVITEMDIEICEGENYNGYEDSGTYTAIYPLAYGCDSTVIIHLDVQGITYSFQEIEVCEGEAFVVNDNEHILYASQEISDTVRNLQGCISNVLIFDVLVNPVVMIDIDITICEGMDYNGLTESGIYTIDSFDIETGCDIVYTIDLEVLPLDDPSCIVGTEEVTELEILMYPNPANEVLYLESKQNIERISVYSIDSKLIKKEVYPDNSNRPMISIDLSDLKSGIYIVEIGVNGIKVYKKIIVQ